MPYPYSYIEFNNKLGYVPRKFAGITAFGWAVIFGINLICAAAAVAIALLA